MGNTVFSVLCLCLGIVLLTASIAKLRSIASFRHVVSNLKFVPERLAQGLSITVIGAEFVLGIGFIFGISLSATLWTCLGLILAMTILSRLSNVPRTELQCFCFGQDGVLANSWKSFLRTSFLISGTVVGIILSYSLPEVQLQPPKVETVAIAFVIVLFLALLTDIPETLSLK